MMAISTKGRYAARIMVLLASRAGDEPITKYEIARTEAISPDYVQQLMLGLKVAGLVASHRGRIGGFSLARDPETVTISDVLRATEGTISPTPCSDAHACDRAHTCPTRDVWVRAAQLLDDLFEGITIAELARDAAKRSAALGEQVAESMP